MSAEYTAETVSDLALMAARGLRQWNLPSSITATLLNLSENATYGLLDPPSGHEWVLRLYRVGYSSLEEIRSELAWIDALLRDKIVDTAAVLAGSDGNPVQVLASPCGGPPRHAVIFERLPGREPAAGAEGAMWFERLGRMTASLHVHARSWLPPPQFRRKRWDFEAMVGERGYWGSWRAGIGLDSSGILAIERALTLIRERLDRFGMGPERFGLIHADLRPANLLVDDGHLRIIDFDDCGFSWFVYDFAAAASFIEHEPLLPVLQQAWIAGYRAIAPLGSADVAEMPTFVMLRRILLTAWLASHGELEFARQRAAAHTAGTVRMARDFVGGG